MNIVEMTKALRACVMRTQGELEEIMRGHVEEYMTAMLEDPQWFAAIMHTSGSEADEAVRLIPIVEKIGAEELTNAVTHKLTAGIISTTLAPALLPTQLVTSINQSLLACLRESIEGDLTFDSASESEQS